MKYVSEKFTDKEYDRIENIKNLLGISIHDEILKCVTMAENVVINQLIDQGYSNSQIKTVLNGTA